MSSSNLSSAFHNGADLRPGFSFGFELVGSLAALDDKLRTFTANAPAGFQPSSFETETVFGGQGSAVTFNGVTYRGPDRRDAQRLLPRRRAAGACRSS